MKRPRIVFVPRQILRIGGSDFTLRRGFKDPRPISNDHGVIAYVPKKDGNVKVVGCFCAYMRNGTLHANGTYVHRGHRGTGLAKKLWRRMLRETKAKRVWVTTISRGGKGLVESLKAQYPKLRWEHV